MLHTTLATPLSAHHHCPICVIIIIIIIWFGDTIQNVIQTQQKCEPCQLNKPTTPFPAGGFPPDTASSTLPNAQAWPCHNHNQWNTKVFDIHCTKYDDAFVYTIVYCFHNNIVGRPRLRTCDSFFCLRRSLNRHFELNWISKIKPAIDIFILQFFFLARYFTVQ